MDNYIENIEFTKIEVILLVGVFLIFLPFVVFPIEDVSTKKDIIDAGFTEEEYTKAKERLDKHYNDEKEDLDVKYNDEKKRLDDKYPEKNFLKEQLDDKYLYEKEDLDKINPKLMGKDLEKNIYKHLKSSEYQNRIYIAFGIAMFLLILTVYLSRKGYTSYTPWLEKLANDKLEFDLKLFQFVDEKNDYEKLKIFYQKTFKIKSYGIPPTQINKEDLLGWKPIDENEKWYSVFTEKLDYRFYEIGFEQLWPEWTRDNYAGKNDEGEYIPKDNRKRQLYDNPELVPDMSNLTIKKELEMTKKQISDELKRLEDNLEKLKKANYYEAEIKKIESRIDKLTMKNNQEWVKDLGDNQSCLDVILDEMDIFEDLDEKRKSELKKILIRKIQNDVVYYAVMINFRRGLQNATKKWLEADEELKVIEKSRIRKDTEQKDVGGKDLENTVIGIIENIEKKLLVNTKSNSENTENPRSSEIVREGEMDQDEKNKHEKINNIQSKLINRNEWESPEWRAMGSIYYKWKEDGKKDKDKDDGKEEADKTVSEKLSEIHNKLFKRWLEREPDVDPTEMAWKDNRTIRAVNSLALSFGFPEGVKTGKAIVFFGVVFALIISVALTNSLDIVIDTLQLPENCGDIGKDDCFHSDYFFLKSNFIEYQYMIILLLCFFPLGILFYHQGVIFLSARASEELTLGNKPLIFVNFLVILLQAIVVYFLAASIGDVNAFLSFLMTLVFIDAVWVSIFTWNDMRDEVRDAPVYLEWIVFDIIIGMFALIFSINYASTPPAYEIDGWSQNLPIFLMLLIALTTRAAVDYSYGWKNFWSKFADAE